MNAGDAKMLDELEQQEPFLSDPDNDDCCTDFEMTPRTYRRLIELARKGADSE